jgi:hypothetical protein
MIPVHLMANYCVGVLGVPFNVWAVTAAACAALIGTAGGLRAVLIVAALTAGLMPGVAQPARASDVPAGRQLIHDGGVEAVAIQPTGR